MTSPRERAEKLIALATDEGASPEEARTAAITACRLIAKNKLRVVDDGIASQPRSAPPYATPVDVWEYMYRTWSGPWPPRPPPVGRNPPPGWAGDGDSETPRARNNSIGRCWACNERILEGDPIKRVTPHGSWCHAGCI